MSDANQLTLNEEALATENCGGSGGKPGPCQMSHTDAHKLSEKANERSADAAKADKWTHGELFTSASRGQRNTQSGLAAIAHKTAMNAHLKAGESHPDKQQQEFHKNKSDFHRVEYQRHQKVADSYKSVQNQEASCYSEQLTANLVGKCRTEEMNGVKYLVAKIAALNPGVLNGSRGPLLYTPEDTRKATKSWNQIPLVVYHPTDDSGKPISANTDGVVHVGFTKNAKYGGKLTVEGWFDVEKTKATDSRVYDALVSGTPMEVSTGLGTTNEEAPAGASYLGQLYSHIARDHRPDHLAILPDQRGACSINDGCGLHVNQQGEKMETVTISVNKTTLRDAVANAVQTVVDSIQIESLCTNCGDDGECAECKAKKLKKKVEETPVENTENCGGEGGTPGPCKREVSQSSEYADSLRKIVSSHETKRDWKQLPADYKSAAVKKAKEELQPYFRGKANNEIKARGMLAKSTEFEHLHAAVKHLTNNQEITTNELSHDDLRQQLNTLLNERYGTPQTAFGITSPVSPANLWVTDVYDKDFVYQDGVEIYRLGYSTDLMSDTVTLSEDTPKKVAKVSTYKAVTNREFLKTLNCGGAGGTMGPCKGDGKVLTPSSSTMGRALTKWALEASEYADRVGGIDAHQAAYIAHKEAAERHRKEGSDIMLKTSQYRMKEHKDKIAKIKSLQTDNKAGKSPATLVANSSDLTRGEPDMAGKLTDADRLKLVEGLTANSGFEVADIYDEDDVEVLNAMSDEKLFKAALAKQTLIDQQTVVNRVSQITGERKVENMASAIQNAFKPFKKKTHTMPDGKEMDDEDMKDGGDDEDMETNSEPEFKTPRQMTEAEFMRMAPPSIRADLEFSRATQNREKQELIGQITANVSGEELDQAVNYLKTKPLMELRIIANVATRPAVIEHDFSTRRSPNYGGQGVPTVNHGRKGKVGEGPKPVTINWAEDVQKHQVG